MIVKWKLTIQETKFGGDNCGGQAQAGTIMLPIDFSSIWFVSFKWPQNRLEWSDFQKLDGF